MQEEKKTVITIFTVNNCPLRYHNESEHQMRLVVRCEETASENRFWRFHRY
jgi:hypothetical protein